MKAQDFRVDVGAVEEGMDQGAMKWLAWMSKPKAMCKDRFAGSSCTGIMLHSMAFWDRQTVKKAGCLVQDLSPEQAKTNLVIRTMNESDDMIILNICVH